jgi:hypothetical protein
VQEAREEDQCKDQSGRTSLSSSIPLFSFHSANSSFDMCPQISANALMTHEVGVSLRREKERETDQTHSLNFFLLSTHCFRSLTQTVSASLSSSGEIGSAPARRGPRCERWVAF